MKYNGHYILDVYSAYRDKMDIPDMLTFYDVVNSLSVRERVVLYYRFWRNETLEGAGSHISLTREGVRQVEAKALRHLRRPKLSRKLRG